MQYGTPLFTDKMKPLSEH